MLNQSAMLDQLARQRVAELHDTERRGHLGGRPRRLSRTRVYTSRALIALGMRLAPTETRATNRVTKLAGR